MPRAGRLLHKKALLLVGLLGVAGLVYFAAPHTSAEDRIAAARSGVAIDADLHVALIDGGNWSTLSSASIEYESQALPTASLFPPLVGSMFQPLAITGASGACGAAMRIDTDEKNVVGGDDPLEIEVEDAQTGRGIEGASVEVYRLDSSGTKLVATGKTDSKGEYLTKPLAEASGISYWSRATKTGYCPVQDIPMKSASGPQPNVAFIPLGITGKVRTAGLNGTVTLTGNITTTYPDGAQVKTPISTTVPAAGGNFTSPALNMSYAKAGLLSGTTLFIVKLQARATDANGVMMYDNLTMTLRAQPTTNGRLELKAEPALGTTLTLTRAGTYTSDSYRLQPTS